jgi:hypothetical protein
MATYLRAARPEEIARELVRVAARALAVTSPQFSGIDSVLRA